MPAFSTAGKTCSFCTAECAEGTAIAGRTGSVICADCVSRYHDALQDDGASAEQCIRAWRAMDKDQMLQQFLAILDHRAQVDDFTREWVALMKDRSVSWSEIGGALGVSRQAAWERFTKPRRA